MVNRETIYKIINEAISKKHYLKCLKYETTYTYTSSDNEQITLELHEFSKNNKKSQQAFYDRLLEAYDYQLKDGWRVEVYDENGDLLPLSNWDNCRMFVTKSGGTIAIREDGDIISVCKNLSKIPSDNMKALMEFATSNGGDRLDSFDGNWGFYRACGFVPVSWIYFNKDYSPKGENGWNENYHMEEPIVFMKYVSGSGKRLTADEVIAEESAFYRNVAPNTGKNAYGDAQTIRDNDIKKN